MASEVDATDALQRARAFGPFYEINLMPGSEQWQRVSDLLRPDDPLLTGELARTRQTLAATSGQAPELIEPRVAASVWLLGWSARLFAPALGAALHGVVPTMPADLVLWQPSPGQPRPLAMVNPRGRRCVPDNAAATAGQLYAACITELIEPLVSVLGAGHSLSLQVMWGNVASAVAGAATSLGRRGHSASRPARDIAEVLLRTGALAGRGGFTRATRRGGRGAANAVNTVTGPRAFQRTNCCLLYRVPGSGICSDCVLEGRGS